MTNTKIISYTFGVIILFFVYSSFFTVDQTKQAIVLQFGEPKRVVNRAKGDTDRFLSIYNSYKVDPDVTRSRIYLETMEKVLSNVNKVIMDKSSSSSGIVPYLPIDKLQGKGSKWWVILKF